MTWLNTETKAPWPGIQKSGERRFLAQFFLFVKPTRLPSVAEEKTVVPTELKYDRGQRRWNHELTDIKFLPSGKKEVSK